VFSHVIVTVNKALPHKKSELSAVLSQYLGLIYIRWDLPSLPLDISVRHNAELVTSIVVVWTRCPDAVQLSTSDQSNSTCKDHDTYIQPTY